MKAIYKMNANCGRNGNLYGIFIAEKEHVKVLIEKQIEIYFGEVLGKNSDVFGCLEEKEIELISEDQNLVKQFHKLKMATGFNPFHYQHLSFEGIEDEDDRTVLELINEIIKLENE